MGLTLLSFIVVMGVVVFIHELGHLLVAKRNGIIVEEFGLGFPPRVVKLFERGGTIYSLNAIPFGGFARMRGEDDPTDPGSFAAASRLARTATLLAGPVMNFILAIVMFTALAFMQGVPDAGKPGAVVKAIAAGSPAEQAGLRVDDRLIAANGEPFASMTDLQTYTSAHLGEPVVYTLVRTDPATGREQTLELTMTPRVHPPANEGALGVQIGVAIRPAQPLEAISAGVRMLGNIIYLTFAIPATLIREGRPIADMGFMGPVGIAATTGDVVRSALAIDSIQPILSFVGLLSAALGITNLLPLPALDGGRLLFIAIEAVRRRRIEPAREGMVHLIGFGLLLLLVGLLTVREIGSLLNGTFPTLGGR